MATINIEFLTKVLPPRRRPDVLRRQRLLDFLHEHIHLRAQVVSAPAGYGKTTLLVDFASDVEIPVCWYSLDASDSDPTVFFDTLLTAIRYHFPDFGQKTEAQLKASPDIANEAAHIISSLTGEMYSNIPELFILVLEDYHSVETDKTIKSILDLLLERAPGNCHIIISSRTAVELPTLAKLYVRREAVRLSQTELAFSTSDVRQLLCEHHKVDISEADAQKLVTESEGWIAGILLGISTSFKGSLIAPKAKLSTQDVFNYLAAEVYEKQPPEIKWFLLRSSTFYEIEPQLCNRLLKLRNSAKLLKEMEKLTLFISRLEGQGLVYRYHNLFRDCLQQKLKEEQPETFIQLHEEAGSIFEEIGQWNQAIDHYLTAGAYVDAIKILKAVGESLLRKGRWQTVSKWLQAIPEKAQLSEPAIALLEAESLIHLGQIDIAIQILNGLLNRLDEGADWLSMAKALSWRGAAFRLTGHFGEALNDVRKAIQLIKQHNGPADILADAYRRLGNVYLEQGRLVQAEKSLKHSLRLFLSVFDVSQLADVHNSLGVVYKRLGDLSRAIAHYEESSQYSEKAQNYGALALTLNNLGVAYRHQGRYDLALNILHDALEKARQTGYQRTQAIISNNLGDVKRDLGLYEEALSYYSQALELAKQVLEPYRATIATAGTAITYRLQGHLDKAKFLLDEAIVQAKERGQDYDVGLFTLQLGILRYQQDKYKLAAQLLQGVYDQMHSLGDKYTMARCALHLAQVSHLERKHQTALAWLRKVSTLVSELGYQQFLVVEGQGMLDLLQYAASRRLGGDLYERILTSIRELGGPAEKGDNLLPPPATQVESLPQVKALALGQSAVFVNSKVISESEWRSAKAREMFFYLLCQKGQANKEQVLSSLWPDVSLSKGNSLFHSNLYRVRRAIFDLAILNKNGNYLVNPTLPVWFDVWEFESDFSEVGKLSLVNQDSQLHLERAVEVYKGPFLQEFYTDWAETTRKHLEDKYLTVLSSLAACYKTQGNHYRAIELLEKAAAIDPYIDEIYYEIVKSYLAMDDRASALRVCRRYTSMLSQELDCEHSTKINELISSILTKRATAS